MTRRPINRLWNTGPAVLTITMLCWAGSVVVGRAAAGLIPPVLFTLLRWGIGLAIVAPLARPYWRTDRAALWDRRWTVVVLSLLSTVAYNILVYRGLHDTTAVNGALMQSVTPLVVLGVGLLIGQRPTRWQAAGIGLSMVGVIAIMAEGSWAKLMVLHFNPGDGLILLAVAAFAVYAIVLRRRPAVHPFSLLVALFSVGLCVLVPLAWAEYLAGARMVQTVPAWAAAIYAGVFASFVATLCFNRGIALSGAARGGQYMHLIPVFGTALAVLVLGETLHPYHVAGAAVIAAGLLVSGRNTPLQNAQRPT